MVRKFKKEEVAHKFLTDRGAGHYWDMAKHFKTPDI